MTIVVILLLFLYKCDDSCILYTNILIMSYVMKEGSRMNMRLLSVSGI